MSVTVKTYRFDRFFNDIKSKNIVITPDQNAILALIRPILNASPNAATIEISESTFVVFKEIEAKLAKIEGVRFKEVLVSISFVEKVILSKTSKKFANLLYEKLETGTRSRQHGTFNHTIYYYDDTLGTLAKNCSLDVRIKALSNFFQEMNANIRLNKAVDEDPEFFKSTGLKVSQSRLDKELEARSRIWESAKSVAIEQFFNCYHLKALLQLEIKGDEKILDAFREIFKKAVLDGIATDENLSSVALHMNVSTKYFRGVDELRTTNIKAIKADVTGELKSILQAQIDVVNAVLKNITI